MVRISRMEVAVPLLLLSDRVGFTRVVAVEAPELGAVVLRPRTEQTLSGSGWR